VKIYHIRFVPDLYKSEAKKGEYCFNNAGDNTVLVVNYDS
jgi:hypothetical protein